MERGKLYSTFIKKDSIFNTAVIANTNIFSANLSPELPISIFRIDTAFDNAGIISVIRTKTSFALGWSIGSVTENLNNGINLVANAENAFDFIVEDGYTINIQYSVNATALYLIVTEIEGVV